MSTYHINGKEYNETEFKEYCEKERQQEYDKLERIIFHQYSPYTSLRRISDNEFFDYLKRASNVIDLIEDFDIDCSNKRLYGEFKNKEGIVCNSFTSSTPCTEYYNWDLVFKYNAYYYVVSGNDSN